MFFFLRQKGTLIKAGENIPIPTRLTPQKPNNTSN